MAFQPYQTVAFGGSKAGLSTVGYRLYTAAGAAVGPRVTAGIQDIGGGQYGATVTFPAGFAGRITWDTGEASPVYASASVNPSESQDEYDEVAQLDQIADSVEDLRDAVAATPEGTFNPPGATPDNFVRAGLPELDDCPILTRFKAFIVDQGVCATLQHTFRNRKGNSLDLSAWLGPGSSESGSISHATPPAGTVKVRIKEWLGTGPSPRANPIWDVYGDTLDPRSGVLVVTLEPGVVEHAGIYELNWAVLDENGRPVAIDRAILSVEKSLFPVDATVLYRDLGPPTIQEVRMLLMDSSPSENLLLDDVEFKDEQLLLAMTKPVQYWNEIPPPLKIHYTTRNFPFRGAWATGVMGQLCMMAANHYRRNVMRGAAGQGADMDKEREYLAEGQRLWTEYTTWCQTKKVECNLRGFVGQSISAYSFRTGW